MAGGSNGREMRTPRRGFSWLGGGRGPTTPEGSVFISYRRGDSAGHTGRLYDGLGAAFGDAAIFMDIDAIDPGVDFAQRIREALATCRVVLVVIGPRWIDASGDDGARRLDDPQDYLRMEIAAALQRNSALVIPVLVAGADMPAPGQLPEPLQPLALRQAVELSDPRWNFDVARLEDVIRRTIARRPDPTPPEAEERSKAGSGGGRRPPTDEPPGDGDGHGGDASGERPSSRVSSTVLAIVLVVLLAGGGALWLDSRRSGGVQSPGAFATTGATATPQPTPSRSSGPAEPQPSPEPTSTPEPAEPTVEPEIAFVRNGQLWKMSDDGTNRRPFSGGAPLRVQHPDWASDGRIVFSSTRDEGSEQVGDTEIWVLDANGEDASQLTDNGVDDATPDWSPAGDRIAFSRGEDAAGRAIYVMTADGRDEKRLTSSSIAPDGVTFEDDDTPDWSPDGDQIVWEHRSAEQYDIWRMDVDGLDGSNPRPVTDTSARDFWPAWSPDGQRIAFRSDIDAAGVARSFDIFTVSVDDAAASGDAYTRITTDGQNDHRPAWSQDGAIIAFDRARTLDEDRYDLERDVWSIRVDGGRSERLTDGSGTNVGPVWRPED